VTPAPLRQLVAARVYRTDGMTQALDIAAFTLDKGASVLGFAPWSLAAPGRALAGIELDIEAGYGAVGSDVPEALRQALRLLAAHWYENRGIAAIGQAVALLPANVSALIAPYRVVAL
jgi:uncharacterized phiE125 gp8 family phage protein